MTFKMDIGTHLLARMSSNAHFECRLRRYSNSQNSVCFLRNAKIAKRSSEQRVIMIQYPLVLTNMRLAWNLIYEIPQTMLVLSKLFYLPFDFELACNFSMVATRNFWHITISDRNCYKIFWNFVNCIHQISKMIFEAIQGFKKLF